MGSGFFYTKVFLLLGCPSVSHCSKSVSKCVHLCPSD